MDDTRPAEALDHVIRPRLPWRTDDRTECGREPGTLPTITRDALAARFKTLGQQRTAFTVCMTCLSRARYSKPWAVAPEAVLEREIQRRKQDDTERLRRELLAIELLITAHAEEFDELLAGLAGTASLSAHRRNRARGGRHA